MTLLTRLGAACALVLCASAGPALAAPTDNWLTDCRLDELSIAPSIPARCGRFATPENPDEPDGQQIELSVAVVPSLAIEPAPDPLVIISGGPGQGATEFYLGYRGAFEPIRLEREIVLVDQRGTGSSNPLRCDDVAESMEEADLESVAAAAKQCLASLPGDPRNYTTSVAVRDLDAVRAALGYDVLNIYGVSYGTRVAQHFMRRFPERTRRVILDGVVYPGLALGPGIAIDAQRALDELFARCTENTDCAARFDDPAATFRTLRARLETTPATTLIPDPNTGRPIEDSIGALELGFAVRLLSYSASTAALIPLVIDEAANAGNFAPLAAQVAMVERSLGGMLAIGMHNAVVCTEDTPFVDVDDALLTALDATYLGRANVDGFATICEHWPTGVLDEDLREPLVSDIPTLLLSGENDPVTPPAYATRAASTLSQSQHIVGPAQGHGLIGLGCVPRLAATFISAETPLPIDASCVDELAAMPFFIDFAGPAR